MGTPRWQGADPARFRVRAWPGEGSANVFDRRSGATHCLSPTGFALIERLGSGPRTLTDLAAELQAAWGDAAPACDLLHDELSRLRTIGLVVSLDPAP